MRVNFPFSNVSNVQSVVTSSRANLALFLSASVSSSTNALSPKGPVGPAGPTVDVDGTPGPAGGFGPAGADGLDALLLSSSRAKCAGDCFQVANNNGFASGVEWTDLNNVIRNDDIPSFDVAYICSRTTPSAGGGVTVTPCVDSPCNELVTTIAESQNIPCSCFL